MLDREVRGVGEEVKTSDYEGGKQANILIWICKGSIRREKR